MPNSKHHKGHKNAPEDVQNDNVQNGNHINNHRHRMERQNDHVGQNGEHRLQNCCMPSGCTDDPIDPNEPLNAVKVLCNNEFCAEGNWMHKECFLEWEQSVLSFLRSCGRARSWSEKQRLQNLWTKKGYDLAYKACDCKCGRGHIRKDLDYIPPPVNDNMKKARKHKKKNDKPMPVVSTNHKGGYNSNHQPPATLDNHHHHNNDNNTVENTTHKKNDTTSQTVTAVINNKRRGSDNTVNNNPSPSVGLSEVVSTVSTKSVTVNGKSRSRNNSINQSDSGVETEILDNAVTSLSSMAFSTSPVMAPSSVAPPALRLRTNSVSSTGSLGSQGSSSGSIPGSAGSMSPLSSSPVNGNVNGNIFFKGRKPETNEVVQQGHFKHRLDLSAFNVLPRYKRNAYNIHIEDVQQDDETRDFVLSSLTSNRMTALRCVLCKHHLPVFDRFPLVDGTLFLSPLAYDQFVVQVIWEGRIQFLNAVCIGCLEGASEANCCSCKKKWDGSSFVVGTMYTFDIFAALPCCQKRLTCKHCRRAVIDASKGLEYYSRYSGMIICPYCKANDFHFIRPLQETFTLKEPICGAY